MMRIGNTRVHLGIIGAQIQQLKARAGANGNISRAVIHETTIELVQVLFHGREQFSFFRMGIKNMVFVAQSKRTGGVQLGGLTVGIQLMLSYNGIS